LDGRSAKRENLTANKTLEYVISEKLAVVLTEKES
jgi:hypothetical protein